MAKKMPKKDINLYTLVVGPKKSTMKKGVLFTVIGIAAVLLLGGGFAAAKVYAVSQDKIAADLEKKVNDPELQEKLQHVNELAKDIAMMRTAGNAYGAIRTEIDYNAKSSCDDFTVDLVEKLVSCEEYNISAEDNHIATITALSFEDQTLHITADSVDSRNISFFVSNLTRLGIFSDVSYESYALTEKNVTYGEEKVSNSVYTYVVDAVFVTHVYEEEPEETTQTTEEATAQ